MQTNGLCAVFMLLNPCFNSEDRNYFGQPITNLFYLNNDTIGHIESWVSFPLNWADIGSLDLDKAEDLIVFAFADQDAKNKRTRHKGQEQEPASSPGEIAEPL